MTLSDKAVEMIVDDYKAIRRALVEPSADGIATLALAAHTAQLHEVLTAIGNDVDKAARMLDAIDDRLVGMNRRER